MNCKLKLAVITPVGRESLTIESFVKEVQVNLRECDVHFLVTDQFTDNKTKEILSNLVLRNRHLKWHHLNSSNGISSVYLGGYRHALEGNFSHFLEIDAGFSHNPNQIGEFRDCATKFDVVLGNRFHLKSNYQSPFKRKIISQGGSLLAHWILNLPMSDLTSGYQLFNREALTKILATGILSTGPFFQTEMKYWAFRLKFNVCEIPISYSNPSHKIKRSDVVEAISQVIRLRIGNK